MNTIPHARPSVWLLRASFGGLLALLAAAPVTLAAELPQFTGFTRPGNPSDTEVGGKVIFAVDDPELRKRAIGGTVYYMVLERSGDAADPWGTGTANFPASFRPGIDFGGGSSPMLDTGAKYLYLYQTVNDRRTETPIESTSVKLMVELKDITSWGYFRGMGFATSAKGGEEKAAAVRPVSYAHVLAMAELERLYRIKAPAVKAPQTYRITRVPSERGEKEPPRGKGDDKIVAVQWDALDPAHEPDYAMLLTTSDFDKNPCFRAIWTGDNVLKKDARSTVYGFTSNEPPKIEPVRIRGPKADKEGVIRPAGAGGVAEAVAKDGGFGAEGGVPTPVPAVPVNFGDEGVRPPASVGFPPLPPAGQPTGSPPGAASAGTPQTGGAGGIGAASSPTIVSGGSSGSGSGSGNGSGSGTSSVQQAATQTQQINFNPTLTNLQNQAQSQSQSQSQRQRQSQRQGQTQANGGEVIPGPSALLLAALGLPALWLLRRRKKFDAVSAA